MLEQALRKLVAVLLVVLCPCSLLMAERPSAVLYATGAVTLNGMPAAKSMSLLRGTVSIQRVHRWYSSIVVAFLWLWTRILRSSTRVTGSLS